MGFMKNVLAFIGGVALVDALTEPIEIEIPDKYGKYSAKKE